MQQGVCKAVAAVSIAVALSVTPALAGPLPAEGIMVTAPSAMPIAASCKQARSCEEAVRMWCDGYKRADGDGDGIPCENVCHSLDEVQKIRDAIGC